MAEKDKFFVLDEINLLNKIKSKDVNYIITTSEWSFTYFEQNPGFVKVAEPHKGASIFAVKQVAPVGSFETIITPQAIVFFECLRQGQPERYQRLKTELFEKTLGWSEGKLESLQILQDG